MGEVSKLYDKKRSQALEKGQESVHRYQLYYLVNNRIPLLRLCILT